jgi:hypothetical protein
MSQMRKHWDLPDQAHIFLNFDGIRFVEYKSSHIVTDNKKDS